MQNVNPAETHQQVNFMWRGSDGQFEYKKTAPFKLNDICGMGLELAKLGGGAEVFTTRNNELLLSSTPSVRSVPLLTPRLVLLGSAALSAVVAGLSAAAAGTVGSSLIQPEEDFRKPHTAGDSPLWVMREGIDEYLRHMAGGHACGYRRWKTHPSTRLRALFNEAPRFDGGQ